jgi:hypothetical protein
VKGAKRAKFLAISALLGASQMTFADLKPPAAAFPLLCNSTTDFADFTDGQSDPISSVLSEPSVVNNSAAPMKRRRCKSSANMGWRRSPRFMT